MYLSLNIYGEHMIRREVLEHWSGGIDNLWCVDGITLFVSNEEEIVGLVNLVKIASGKLGLRINASKTKVVVVNRVKWLPVFTADLSMKQMGDRWQKYGAEYFRLYKLWSDYMKSHVTIRSPERHERDLYNHLFSLTLKADDENRIDAFEKCLR